MEVEAYGKRPPFPEELYFDRLDKLANCKRRSKRSREQAEYEIALFSLRSMGVTVMDVEVCAHCDICQSSFYYTAQKMHTFKNGRRVDTTRAKSPTTRICASCSWTWTHLSPTFNDEVAGAAIILRDRRKRISTFIFYLRLIMLRQSIPVDLYSVLKSFLSINIITYL